jgi:hypothetical protein
MDCLHRRRDFTRQGPAAPATAVWGSYAVLDVSPPGE